MRLLLSIICLICAHIVCATQSDAWAKRNTMQSESPFFESITRGMSSTYCNDIICDKDGYIWIATSNSIIRYDGVHMQTFFAPNSVDQYYHSIGNLYEDTINNCIWATMRLQNKILCINKNDYSCSSYDYSNDIINAQQSNLKTYIPLITNYCDSLLLMSCNKGMFLYNKKTHHFKGPFKNREKKTPTIKSFIDIDNKTYYLLDRKIYVIYEKDPDEPKIREIKTDVKGIITYITGMDDHSILITSRNNNQHHFWSYNTETEETEFITSINDRATEALYMNDGIWYFTASGLGFYHFESKTTRKYTTRNSTLISNKFNCMIKMKTQPIIWIGTNYGIVKNDYLSSKFELTDMRRFSKSNTCDLFTIFKDTHNNYWAWFADGLYVKRNNDDTYHPFNLEEKLNKRFPVLNICEDTIKNCLYLASNKAIVKLNLHNNELTNINIPNNIKSIESMIMSPSNKVVVCSLAGILIIENDKVKFTPFDPLFSKKPCDMSLESDSIAWIGDNTGNIFRINLYTNKTELTLSLSDKDRMIKNLRFTKRNNNSELWISTTKRGLYYYLPQYNRYNRIEYSNIVTGDDIDCLEIDKNNNVWASSSLGLICINNNDGKTYEYRTSTHNICPSFNYGASTTTHDGKVIMGGTNYMIEFDSRNFSTNDYYPAPIIASYRFSNSTALSYDDLTYQEILNNSDTINIPKGIRSLQIFVRVLNYNNSHNNKIMWRLPDSENNQWQTSVTTSPILFNNIKYGVQALELRTCDSNGQPTTNSRYVYLNKQVYFYEHPAFSVVITLLGIALVFFIIFIKTKIDAQQRLRLEIEVDRQAGEIRKTNIALTKHKDIIDKQNLELQEQKRNLEKEVADRTADLKVAFERAEENSQLKSAFLANLSHEVRTPMNCIMGFSKLIAENLCTPEESQEYAHLIRESGSSLLVLINDLLDISRIESGQLRVNCKDFPIYQEITETYNLLQVERKNEDVKFILSNDDALIGKTICSDKDRFRQIIINIVYNAFKFTPSGYVKLMATITTPNLLRTEYQYPTDVALPHNRELLLVSIEDTGVGIPKDKLEVIFEPFRKLNAGKKSMYPGLGLGLNIVKNLVSHMGGQIWVTSEEGQGTTFYFYLPF